MSATLPPLSRLSRALGLSLVLCAGGAQAYTIASVSPQGEVARVRQVVLKFGTEVIRMGDARAPAPVTITCNNTAAAAGSGRWNTAREWVYDFRTELPPGVSCQVQLSPSFKALDGSAPTGKTSFNFGTGGPAAQWVRPYGDVEEEQTFLLRLNGEATPASVAANVWCASDSVGERIPIRLQDGAERQAALQAAGEQAGAAQRPGRYFAFSCNRRLTPGTRLQIVYGKGVSTPSGIASRFEQRFTFQVREPFTINTSCERENAQAACTPLFPVEVSFSAPVPRRLAEQLRLSAGSTEYKPSLSDDLSTDPETLVDSLRFKPPFAENTPLSLSLPADMKDASGRTPANADRFPLSLATGPMPPLAKFAAAPFGVVERFAEGPKSTPLLPITVRRVEQDLPTQALDITRISPDEDARIIEWFRRLHRYDSFVVPIAMARKDVRGKIRPLTDDESMTEARSLSLLDGQQSAARLQIPPIKGDANQTEVVGVPLAPGFHVIELASQRLGQALMEEGHGAQRTMYVRTSALVTNLGVHFKLGREGSLAWVTTLDKGQPVAGATVRVSACNGKSLATATTDAQGIARFKDLSPQAPSCHGDNEDDSYDEFGSAYFISARARNEGVDDMAFTWSTWQRGIESWRFNVPTSHDPRPDTRAHTIFDRTLLRAGETVSMKHLLRTETAAGFTLPSSNPDTLVITHEGSGQEFTRPLQWRDTATGGRSAETSFALPPTAKLGVYRVSMRWPERKNSDEYTPTLDSGEFRVEEFRLPVMQGRVGPQDKAPLVAAASVPVQVQLGYISGGPANGLPVQVSAITRERSLHFADYEDFSFDTPRPLAEGPDTGSQGEEEVTATESQQVVADKIALTLDAQGLAQTVIDGLKPAAAPRQLVIEANYPDPNGEIQTLRSQSTLWPAAVLAGVRAESWISTDQTAKLQALALDLNGKPKAGVPLQVKAIARITTTSRKRMVGGFYTYDNRTHTRDLGTVCSGKSDAHGLLSCDAKLAEPGQVELVVSASDEQGRSAQAAATVWVTRQGELWFGGENHDRMDVLAEQKQYQPGDTARFQVRMPFRQATALVTVEREGILHSELVQLQGSDPTVSLKIDPAWGPNAYVNVLALRGRLREVPWYSFFTWGFKSPRQWWREYRHDSKDYVAPTAMVDLSKPAFRLGMAEIRVGAQAYQLDVSVKADQEKYPVRGTARVTVQAKLPDGKPAANAEVALAAVDQALLELKPNTSWKLLEAMLQRRPWGVETATAQTEIIGRRHYGRKAVPAGGDGGGAPTRELLDTLLLWQPRLQLDAQGQASVDVPLNDALSSFAIVAVADAGTGRFGSGQTLIRTTQDLQIISGLPPLVRAGDAYRAQITLRNTTEKDMKVQVEPRATLLELAAQTVDIPAGQAREVHWQVTAPPTLAALRPQEILWEISARDQTGGARDALKAQQRVVPAVPTTVQQATLVQLNGELPYLLDVAAPADALPGRSSLQIALQPRLGDGLPGVRDWLARYPYTCLEQTTSKAIGMRDTALWQKTAADMPGYLDEDGLAYYFPPRSGTSHQGSPTLTAWLLSATHEAARLNPDYALPEAVRAPMLAGLRAFVEGRIERRHWSPRHDLEVRKLAAIEALARHGKATPAMLTSISIAPDQWPTHAVLDWISILERVKGIPQQAARLDEAMQVLRTRLSWQGTRLIFDTEREDHWWWLMSSGDVNTARLLLTVMNRPEWRDDLGRIVTGFLNRQQGGAWNTTTANLWGSLALEQFTRAHEKDPVSGQTLARLGSQQAQVDWAKVTPLKADDAQGLEHARSLFGAPAHPGQLQNNSMQLPLPDGAAGGQLNVTHQGSGKPWMSLRSLAAVPLKQPFAAGYSIRKTITPVEQADKTLPAGQYTRGDVLRITLEVQAQAPMTWVAITDPVPGGATILGSGLGRDSEIATAGEQSEGAGWLAYEERSFEAFRSYYQYLPRGTVKMQYSVRLNNSGAFQLPPSRVEALYAPEVFGEAPNGPITVK